MHWIDVSCRGGSARAPGAEAPPLSALVREMDRLRIAKALLMSAWSESIAPEHANRQLFDDVVGEERLLPVPEALPEGSGEFLDRQSDAVADWLIKGAAAAVVRCRKNGFLLAPWCAGEMLAALEAVRLPLMVFHGDVEPDHMVAVLSDFPRLPVILQGVSRSGYHRIVFPLLKRFPQLHLVCDPPQFVHQGIEYLVGRLGAAQLLWGTRYPECEGGAAVAGIMYADIGAAERAAIAGGNIERLLSEVRRG